MIKLGVLYNCEGKIKDQILTLKKEFLLSSSKKAYLNHPAHISFYVFEIEERDLPKATKAFELITEELTPTKTSILGWSVFEKDLMTGLNTAYLELQLNDDLKKTQVLIAETLCVYASRISPYKLYGPYLKSYDKYGYPFVGDHWIPHISIGSLGYPKKEILQRLKSENFNKEIVIDKFNLFLIQGDAHTIIKTKTLK